MVFVRQAIDAIGIAQFPCQEDDASNAQDQSTEDDEIRPYHRHANENKHQEYD